MFQLLTEDRVWALAQAVLAAGLGLAVRALTRRRREIQLEAKIVTTTLLSKLHRDLPGFQATMNGRTVEELQLSLVGIWNGGRQAVLPSNFAPTGPLQVDLGESGLVLGAEVAGCTRPTMQPRLVRLRNSVRIDLDHLNTDDALIIRILHDGTTKPSISAGLVGDRPKLKVVSEHRAGVHGNADGQDLIVNSRTMRAFAWVYVVFSLGTLLAAYSLQIWWPVLVAITLFATQAGLLAWPSGGIPRHVRQLAERIDKPEAAGRT